MISLQKLFRDVPKMIQRCVTKHTNLNDGMHLWIDYCEKQFPAGVWSRLRKLDYDADYDRLTLWAVDLLRDEPPSSTINGLWFGLFNPCDDDGKNAACQVYLAGSKRYGKPDWPCAPEYWPEGRYADSHILPELYRRCEKLKDDGSYLGEAVLCHGYIALVLARWCRGPIRDRLLGKAKSRAVAFGHDSGDIYSIDVIQSTDQKR